MGKDDHYEEEIEAKFQLDLLRECWGRAIYKNGDNGYGLWAIRDWY